MDLLNKLKLHAETTQLSLIKVSQSMIHKGAQKVTKDTNGTKDHTYSTKTKPKPYHSQPNHVIERGSQTACNSKFGYHDSCTLYRGSTLYPRVVISSLAKWL
jgi:hypothetical protein